MNIVRLLAQLREICSATVLTETGKKGKPLVWSFARGSLIVVAIGDDVLFGFGDVIDKTLAGPVIGGVRSVLAPHNLDLVWSWGDSWAHA